MALPVLSYGYYPAFVEYPGSVSIGRNTCRDTVVDICRSVAAHGANKIYLLNTGISTNWSLEPARHLLAASKIVMDYTDLSRLNMGSAAKCIEQSAGSHADEVETSRMLHIAPDQVRMDLAKPELCGGGKAGPLTRNPTRQNAQYSPSGVFGDPTLATAHKGELLTLALVECLIEDIERLASADYQAPPPRQQYL